MGHSGVPHSRLWYLDMARRADATSGLYCEFTGRGDGECSDCTGRNEFEGIIATNVTARSCGVSASAQAEF